MTDYVRDCCPEGQEGTLKSWWVSGGVGRAEVGGGTSMTWTKQVPRPWGRKGLGKQTSGIGGERAREMEFRME